MHLERTTPRKSSWEELIAIRSRLRVFIACSLDGFIAGLVVTLIPTIPGDGHPLFAGAEQRHILELKDPSSTVVGCLRGVYYPQTRMVEPSGF